MTNIAKIFAVAVDPCGRHRCYQWDSPGQCRSTQRVYPDHLENPKRIPSVTWSGERYPGALIGSAIGPTS